jgi:hypothetical protein
MATSQALAERDIADQQGEPADAKREHDQVEHRTLLRASAMRALPVEKARDA